MPKKKKEADNAPLSAPLPPIDEAYVQSVKIQALEERNAFLKAELETERIRIETMHGDHLDVTQHLQRDLRSKSTRIADLQASMRSLEMRLQQTIEMKDQEMRDFRADVEEREEYHVTEMQRMTEEINDNRLFKERKSLMEHELAEVRKDVAELRVRHEQELADIKREHDLKNAALHAQLEQKIQEKERSVEDRAMHRVDAVTKKTIMLNQRRMLEIENLHKEVRDLQRVNDRLAADNKELKFEVAIKSEEVQGAGERLSQIKGALLQQLEVNEGHAEQESVWKQVSDRGDKHTLVLQMMIRTLEDRIATQAKQIQWHQQRERERQDARQGSAKSLPPSLHPTLPMLPPAGKQRDFLNFIRVPEKGGRAPSSRRESAGTSRRVQAARLVAGQGGGVKDGVGKEISRDDVVSLLLASLDTNPSGEASRGGSSTGTVHASGAVTHR